MVFIACLADSYAGSGEDYGQTFSGKFGWKRYWLKLQYFSSETIGNKDMAQMGAVHFAEPLQTEVEDKLAELLLKGDFAGSTLKIGVKAGQLKFDIA